MESVAKKIKTFPNLWFLLALLTVSAFLRLYRIEELMRFIWDEGRDMLAIREIIVSRDLTFFGPFNEIDGRVDFFGVFHYYLMLPALWLANFNPVGPAIFTALLGVAAVGLAYLWARKWMKSEQAFGVASLLAVSPLVVQYQRWPWNPNTVSFFALLFLLCLQAWREKPRYILAIGAGFFLGVLFQLHYFTVAFAGAAGIALLWQKSLQWRHKFFHGGVFLLSWLLPNLTFVIFDITHEGFYRKILLASFQNTGSAQQLFEIQPGYMLFSFPLYILDTASKFMASPLLGIGVSMVFFWWLLQVFRTAWSEREADEQVQLATAWMLFAVIIAFFPSIVDDYHSAALWIAFPVAIIIVLTPLFRRLPRTVFAVLLFVSFAHFLLANRLTREPTVFENMPRVRSAAEAVAQDAQGKDQVNVASFVDADTRATRFRYFLTQADIPLLDFNSYPQTETLYLVSPFSWEESRQNPAWEIETFQNGNATEIWADENWRVYRLTR